MSDTFEVYDDDAAALKARTAWDDSSAAWAEADRLREIRDRACTRLIDELHRNELADPTKFIHNGKTYRIINRIPVRVPK